MSAVTAPPSPELERRNHIFAVSAATVLALGLLRAVLLVTHTPALGYTTFAGAQAPGLHALGLVALALVAAVAVVTALALRPHPVASIVHALLFFLIVADPVATLWLNSSNAERWALVGSYASASMAVVIALGRPSRLHWMVFLLGFIALACGPRAFAGLPLAIAIVMAPLLILRSRTRGWVAIALGLALVVLAPIFVLEDGKNLSVVAPMGPSMVPAARVEKEGAREPRRSLHAMARILPVATALGPSSLDVSSEGRVRSLADLPPRVMSFTALVSAMPAPAATMIAMVMILTLPFAIAWLAWVARRGPPDATAIAALYTVLISILAYSVVAASLAGVADIARSQWLGALAMLAAVLLLPLVAWHLSRDFWGSRIALAAAFAILLMAVGWFASSRDEPLSIGTIERITSGANGTLEVSGWVIDPRGMKRVYATVGGGPQTTATLGTERRDLQAAYPGYPDALTGGFQMTIAPNAWRGNETLRIYAEGRTGAVTEIDRREIRLAP